MNAVLLFAAPPLAGAFIGFVTNVIAIRMLFRPLKEIRVFGIRLPFTPGILPRQRHKLAESIGGMVERELLTPELLRQRLFHEEVRESLYQSVTRFTGEALASPSGDLLKEGSLSGEIVPVLLQALSRFLRRPDIRRELEGQGRVFLTRALLNLNVFQRLLVTAGGYEETLSGRMPEIIDSLIDQLESGLSDQSIRERLRARIGAESTLEDLTGLSGKRKQALDAAICSRLINIADAHIENVLAAIDVKKLVTERIDSLEMIRVERIILDVMANQFKWIDVFGGILGFLIGLFQSLLSFMAGR